MKIFLTGAQGTGKTTLNKQLYEIDKIKKLECLDSTSHKFAKSKDVFKKPETLLEFQTKLFAHCMEQYLNHDNFISSRYFADMYAYCKYEYDKGFKEYKTFMDAVLLASKYIEGYIIYVPIMFEVEGTNMRSADKNFQKEIDNNIKEYLDLSGLKYYTIKTLDNRVSEVLNYINL